MKCVWEVATLTAVSVAAFPGGRAVAAETNAPVSPAEIVVTATRTETSAENVPASVDVIDRAAVVASGAVSVGGLLRNTAGVDLQGGELPGAATRLNLRGLTPGYQSERVLVLVDGRRVNDAYIGNVEFALMPAGNIERIEILRGPASALYGSNAEGGVINIVTRRGRATPVTELKAEAGDYGTRIYRLSHGWKSGALDYFVVGGYEATGGYTKNSDGTKRDWSAWDLTGNFGWEIDEDSELRLHVGQYRAEGTDENSDRKARRDYQSAAYNLKWNEERDARLIVRGYRNGQHDVYDWKYPGEGIYRLETLGAEAQQSLWLSERHLGTVGVETRRDSANIDEVSGKIAESSATLGVYAQDEIVVADPLRLTVGAREDHVADYGGQWSPRVGLLWHAADCADLYASYNRAYRAPSLSDRFVRTEFGGALFVGNPDLKPETLTAYEVGCRLRPTDRLSAEVTLFLNEMKDSFDFMLDSDGVFRSHNVSRSRTAGFECGLGCRLTETLAAFANYSYTDGTYESDPNPEVEGNRLAYLAPSKASAGLSCRGPGGMTHALSGRYVDSREGDAQNTSENRMGRYVAFDWRSRMPLHEHATATLTVLNILDETYQEFPRVDQPGRTVLVGVEAAF